MTRDEVIERYDVLGHPTSPDLQALVEIAAEICDVPTAAINLITSTEQHQVAAAGFEASTCAREDSMCAAVVDDPRPVVVPDAGLDPRFEQNPFVTGDIGKVRFYASAPLVADDGVPIGRLCVFDDTVRELSEHQRETLEVLARRIMDVLALRLRTRELEQSLAELTAARDELRRSNEHLTLFAGQVSHDLRTPLTAILANAEMLAGEEAIGDDEDLSWMVDGISRAAQRMNKMIEEMLAYAREGGALTLTVTSLDRVFRTAVEDLAPVIAEKDAELVLGRLPLLPADAHQMYAVALNLLSNALKFSRPDTPPRVAVTSERLDAYWRVSVTDNGIGVAQDRREAMFVLFARADKRVEGSGIGLATVKRVIEAHGGRIGMDEAEGGGTTVWFELPA